MRRTPLATDQAPKQVNSSFTTRVLNPGPSSPTIAIDEQRVSGEGFGNVDLSTDIITTDRELPSNQNDPANFDIYDKKWDQFFADIDKDLGIGGTFQELEQAYNTGSTPSQEKCHARNISDPRDIHDLQGPSPRPSSLPIQPSINPFKENGEPKMVHQARLLREFLGGARFQRELQTVVLAPGKSDTLHNRKSAIITSLCAKERVSLMEYVKAELGRRQRGGGSHTRSNLGSPMSSGRELDASLATFDFGTMAEFPLGGQSNNFKESGIRDGQKERTSGETSQRAKTSPETESAFGISSSPAFSAQHEGLSARAENNNDEIDPYCSSVEEHNIENMDTQNDHHMSITQFGDYHISDSRIAIPEQARKSNLPRNNIQSCSLQHPRNGSTISSLQTSGDTETRSCKGHHSRYPREYTDLGSGFGIWSFSSKPKMPSLTSQPRDEAMDAVMEGMNTSDPL